MYLHSLVPVTLFLLIMRNMRSKEENKVATMRDAPVVSFVKCEGSGAIHPFIIRELVTPFQSPPPPIRPLLLLLLRHLLLSTSFSPPCHPLPFLPRSDPFISMFVTAFSVVALFETTLMGVNVKPISTPATRFRVFRVSRVVFYLYQKLSRARSRSRTLLRSLLAQREENIDTPVFRRQRTSRSSYLAQSRDEAKSIARRDSILAGIRRADRTFPTKRDMNIYRCHRDSR